MLHRRGSYRRTKVFGAVRSRTSIRLAMGAGLGEPKIEPRTTQIFIELPAGSLSPRYNLSSTSPLKYLTRI
jgi:hypothetical protein